MLLLLLTTGGVFKSTLKRRIFIKISSPPNSVSSVSPLTVVVFVLTTLAAPGLKFASLRQPVNLSSSKGSSSHTCIASRKLKFATSNALNVAV